MRPPIVKRQPLPKSGCCHFFPAVLQAKRRPPLATCAVCLAVCWGTNVTAPHTSCGASAIGRAVTERMARVRGALETALSPHTVLRKPWGGTSVGAREAQGRGRGSPRAPSGTFARGTGARAGVQANAQGQGQVPLGAGAFVDAREAAGQRTGARRRPSWPSEAAGASAPLPSLWSKVSRSHPPRRGHR